MAAGANPKNCICLDSKGVIHPKRQDIDWEKYPNKKHAAWETKPKIVGSSAEALEGADVVIGFSKPGSFTTKDVTKMSDRAIIFACANPIPEIDPIATAALENVIVVGTGRSDFPNQVNNSLFFPGCMAGTLAVGGTTISDDMVIAGATTLANQTESPSAQNILPAMTLKNMSEISPNVAESVAETAIKEGTARFKKPLDQIHTEVQTRILHNQKVLKALAEANLLS